ncbi:MAG: hypothetical protein ACYTXA_21095 [Nostoc sp.]
MKIETITYKRVKNLGNYQSETLEATARLDDGDDPGQTGQYLKDFVLGQLYPPSPVTTTTDEDKPAGADNNPF